MLQNRESFTLLTEIENPSHFWPPIVENPKLLELSQTVDSSEPNCWDRQSKEGQITVTISHQNVNEIQ